jgi:hypothetical protein
MSSSGQRVFSVRRPCAAASFVADDGQKALARGRVQRRVVQQFDGRLQVADVAAVALGQLVQPAVALGVFGEVARDVVQHQHEAVQRHVDRGVGCAHRGHLHAQQLSAARAGDELRRRVRRTARQALLHGFERVAEQLAVQQRVDRTTQAQRLGTTDGRALLQRAELQPRASVEEQDAAVQVAHHHALRQLGHQRGQAVAFLRHLAAGFGHLGLDAFTQGVALQNQRVDLHRQSSAARTAFGLQARRGVAGQQHLQAFGQAAGCDREMAPGLVQRPAAGQADDEPQHQHQREARLDQDPERAALGGRHGEGQQPAQQRQHGRQQHAGQQSGGDLGRLEPRLRHRSISRTRAASSLVEKGLVT